MWKRGFIFFALIVLLGSKIDAAPIQSGHLPFSAEQAEQAFNAGKAQYQNGNLSEAIKHFQKTLQAWPVHQGAWQWLTGAYQHLNQPEDYQHALFFRERTAWALEVDLRHAKRIFDDVAKKRKRTTEFDARYAATAERLATFYDYVICRTQAARESELAKHLTINQKYGLEKLFKLAPDPKRRKCWPVK